MPNKKGHVVTIEVVYSENIKGVVGQSESKSGTSDQSKQLNQVQQFMEIRKEGASINKIYDS